MLPKGEKGNAVPPSVADNENGGDKKNEDTDKWVAKRQVWSTLHFYFISPTEIQIVRL